MAVPKQAPTTAFGGLGKGIQSNFSFSTGFSQPKPALPNTLGELKSQYGNVQQVKDRMDLEIILARFNHDLDLRCYVIQRIHGILIAIYALELAQGGVMREYKWDGGSDKSGSGRKWTPEIVSDATVINIFLISS